MARPLRIEYPGAYYHVTCRGNERRKIFLDKGDHTQFLKKLFYSLDVYHVLLHAYVCMANHFHLLLSTPEGNLSEFMRHFNICYTTVFNRQHGRVGHLFQGRYKAYLIDADSYLTELSRYIHLNPVRLKVIRGKSITEKWKILDGYEWSSLRGYLAPKTRLEYVDYGMVMRSMGGDTKKGRERYLRFLELGMGREGRNPLDVGRGHGIVGGRQFIERMREKFGGGDDSAREKPALRELRKKYYPEELIDRYAKAMGIEQGGLCERGKRTLERAMLVELLYRYCDVSQAAIGRYVGGIDYSAVSNIRRRLHERWGTDEVIKARFERVIKEMELT